VSIKTHYYTGRSIRMCYCSRNPLQVYTDGKNNYAHCKDCGKTWNLSKMIEVKNNPTKTLDKQNGLGVG